MDPAGRFNMLPVWHADDVAYARALCWMMSRTEGDRVLTGRYELAGRAKSYNEFHLVNDADDWIRELDVERRQGTSPKER